MQSLTLDVVIMMDRILLLSVLVLVSFVVEGKPTVKPTVPANWKKSLKRYKNGNVIFEGDMILPQQIVERAVENGRIKPENRSSSSIDGEPETDAITAPLYKRWPGAVVPYVIDKSLTDCGILCAMKIKNPRGHINRAMAAWSKKTCIKFRKKTSRDRDYISFQKSKWGHCASHVGRVGGKQPIFLGTGCKSDGTIMHEIGHALGFFHEQSRPDRDDYVKINYNNVKKKYWPNFQKYTRGISDMGTPYDYKSIMHYGSRAFVKGWKIFSKTIVAKNGAKIGQRKKLSDLDIKEANLYYGCDKQN